MVRHHGVSVTQTREFEKGGGETATYVVPPPRVLKTVKCPVPGCQAVVHITSRLRENFMYKHFRLQVAVAQEGTETLPRFKLYGMNMPAGRLIKHQRKRRCDRNTQMQWWRRDVAIPSRYTEDTFSFTGEDEVQCIEGVGMFKYLRQLVE